MSATTNSVEIDRRFALISAGDGAEGNGALVLPPDVIAVEALFSHPHPCAERAVCWELFDGEANCLGCGGEATITERLTLRFGVNSSAEAALASTGRSGTI